MPSSCGSPRRSPRGTHYGATSSTTGRTAPPFGSTGAGYPAPQDPRRRTEMSRTVNKVELLGRVGARTGRRTRTGTTSCAGVNRPRPSTSTWARETGSTWRAGWCRTAGRVRTESGGGAQRSMPGRSCSSTPAMAVARGTATAALTSPPGRWPGPRSSPHAARRRPRPWGAPRGRSPVWGAAPLLFLAPSTLQENQYETTQGTH